MNNLFADKLEKVCWHPNRYTPSGTFNEAFAFLNGYATALMEADPEAAEALSAEIKQFNFWLAERLHMGHAFRWEIIIQRTFDTDAERLKQLRWLFADFRRGVPSADMPIASAASTNDEAFH